MMKQRKKTQSKGSMQKMMMKRKYPKSE